jgi:hypothetical protein
MYPERRKKLIFDGKEIRSVCDDQTPIGKIIG